MRYLSSAERGDFVLRLAAWPGIQGPERLLVFQMAGSLRLTEFQGRLLCDVTLEELGDSLGRSASAIRSSLSRLRAVGVQRSDEGRNAIDLTRLAEILGFELEHRVDEIAPGGVGLRGARAARAGAKASPRLATACANPEGGSHQKSGASPYTSKSHEYINSIILDNAEEPENEGAHPAQAEALPLSRIREIMQEMLRPEVADHLNRKDELKAFLDGVLSLVGEDWSEERLRDAAERMIPQHFRQCDAGAGLTLRLAREGGRRFGASLVLHAAHAIMHARQPKGLLVSMIKGSKASPRFTEFCIGNALKEAAAEASIAKYQAQYDARKAGIERCAEVMRAVMSLVQTAPELDPEERSAVQSAARGYAKMFQTDTGDTALVMGLPSHNDAMLWTRVVDRLSCRIRQADLPTVTVYRGGLTGSAIRLCDVVG